MGRNDACGARIWAGCVVWIAVSASGAETPLTTIQVVSGLSRPVLVTHVPGDSDRVFIVEQGGKIRILKDGILLAAPFLDLDPVSICCGEQGLLGLAFHPGYAENGEFFVNYTDDAGTSVVARYTVSAEADTANPVGEILLTIPQPFANHNGGWIGFGPDGYLYIATGDGGSGNDPGNRAQDITDQLLGKLLRIDVNGDDFPADPNRNYSIPPGNPFAGTTGDDEIWAYGLRNPWRCSFDRGTGDLYIGDVGQGAWEEINFQPGSGTGGANYGWRCMEGAHCTGLTGCTCFDAGLVLPIQEYSHSDGCSITGGYVYRGCAIPDLRGTYFYADYCQARIWTFRYDGAAVADFRERTAELAPGGGMSIGSIASFGEDALGELYICDLGGGEVFKIAAKGGGMDCNGNSLPDGCERGNAPADLDVDGDVDGFDFLTFANCFNGSNNPALSDCLCPSADLEGDGDVDGADFLTFSSCFNGSSRPPSCP